MLRMLAVVQRCLLVGVGTPAVLKRYSESHGAQGAGWAFLTGTPFEIRAVAKHYGIDAFVNMSQMTVSQMSLTNMTGSPQHQQQFLAEQVLSWSALPVVEVRTNLWRLEAGFPNQSGS